MKGIIENPDKEEKILKLMGFSSKMGKLIYGKEPLENYLKDNANTMIFLASDCSQNTQKLWINKCSYNNAALFKFTKNTKIEIAQKLGKNELSAFATDNTDIIAGIEKILETK